MGINRKFFEDFKTWDAANLHKIISQQNDQDIQVHQRYSSNQYPFVFGQLKVISPEYDTANKEESLCFVLIHRNHCDNQFAPKRSISDETSISPSSIFTTINLTPEEAYYLQKINGIKLYNPINGVPLHIAFGLQFTLMVDLLNKETFALQDAQIAFIGLTLTTMILYPLFYRGWKMLPGTDKTVNFSNNTLLNVGLQMGLLLCLALGFMPVAQSQFAKLTNNPYQVAALLGASSGALFGGLAKIRELLTNQLSIGVPSKERLQVALRQIATPTALFPLVLIFQTFLQKKVFNANELDDYKAEAIVPYSLLVTFILTILEWFLSEGASRLVTGSRKGLHKLKQWWNSNERSSYELLPQ